MKNQKEIKGLRKVNTRAIIGTKKYIYMKNKAESFNDWGGERGCNKFVPVLGGDGTKIAPPRDLFDQAPDEMN